MPNVQQNSQVRRSGQKTRADIKKAAPQAMARDDLDGAYAGRKNNSASARKSAKAGKATHEKGRRLRRDEGKEPVR